MPNHLLSNTASWYKKPNVKPMRDVLNELPFIPVVMPLALSVSVELDDGNGSPTVLEIVLPTDQFERLYPVLNGEIVQLRLRSVRPLTPQEAIDETLTPLDWKAKI